ncbi:MAG: HD domain-containing protein [Candidatus Omnitrophica bacterium]|nr:HD domain-containing protein [Candidatus Omnitrophota bacterium]
MVTKKDNKIKQLSEAMFALVDTSKHSISMLDYNNILYHVTVTLPRVLDLDAMSVRMFDRRNPRLMCIEQATGISQKISDKIRYSRIGVGIDGIAAKRRCCVIIKDIARDKRVKFKKELLHSKMRSALCAPIIFDNDVFGTIAVYSKEKDSYRETDGHLLASFANIVGIALKNAKLYTNLKDNYLSTVNSLALIMESRDPYMRGHSERVTYISVEIAKEMRLSESDLVILRTAGKLHDIGKITISDNILLKPGRLTPSEWAQMHMHPIRGAEIVLPLKFLEPGISLIRNHHERYDGKGYPDGLGKTSIPLLARILSVSDAFDAMTSIRPYRKPLTHKRAIDEINENSGSQFDPAVTKSFLEIIDKI